MKVAEFISQFLDEKKVSHVFGVSGANIEDLFFEIHKKKKTTIILAKNEYNASTMALGNYLATKKIGVVLTTSGPGILNTLPILAEAYTSNIPMVLISGIVPEQLEGQGAFQDTSGKAGSFNICEMISPCTSFHAKISDPDEILQAMERAFYLSLKNKKPSVVLIPKDLFEKEIKDITFISDQSENKNEFTPDQKIIHDIANKFSNELEVPPLIILGEELIHLKSSLHLLEFIKKSFAAVALTPNSKGLFEEKNVQYLGLIGIMGHEEVNAYLSQATHVILVGTNLDILNRFGLEVSLSSKNLLIIKEEKNLKTFFPKSLSSLEMYGDIDKIFEKINENLKIKKTSAIKIKKSNPILEESYELPNIIRLIQERMEKNANIFIDAGNTGAFVVHFLETKPEGICHVSLGMGGMGNSVGLGIGSAAGSGNKSYVFLGDGSFLMHGLEIHTAIQYNLPTVFIILNNNSHAMCSTREQVFLNAESGINNFKESFFAEGLGKMFPGLIAHEVNNLSQLQESLNFIENKRTPCVLSINISREEKPPFKSFIKTSEALK